MLLNSRSMQLVQMLSEKIPELAWRLARLEPVLHSNLFPVGLFQRQLEWTPQACIDDVYTDLDRLKEQTNQQAIDYLSNRLLRKITVLVRICQNQAQKSTVTPSSFGIDAISTRQQWLQGMHLKVTQLESQQSALEQHCQRLKATDHETAVLLRVQAELGQAERRLAEAKEAYARAITV